MTTISGKVSWFGGPDDEGVAPDEGLAFIYDVEQAPHLFLTYQPEDTTGLARRLNPNALYVACRWDYSKTPKDTLLDEMALVRNVKTGMSLKAYPADWGPHEDTGRICDISPGLMEALDLNTDDVVEVTYPYTSRRVVTQPPPRPEPAPPTEPGLPPPLETPPTYERIVISSGHGKYVRGASGVIDEVEEARRVVEDVATILRSRGVDVVTFHDDKSKDQNSNLNAIVNYHNKQDRDLDVSVHFNAYVETTAGMGTECLYVTQLELATRVADALGDVGFKNRGAKKRTDLFFLNQTDMPSILIEVCFVDSQADADIYEERYEAVCDAIADALR